MKNENEEEVNFNIEPDDNESNGNIDGNRITPSFVPKRNELLLRFFKEIVFPHHEIILLGDENSPAVIIDNQYVLSCYVKNFFVNFMDKVWDSNLVFSVKLSDSLRKENYDIQKIRDWYAEYEHRKVFKILLDSGASPQSIHNPPLFLAGWNYKDSENKHGKYPVFALHKPKLYLTNEKVTDVKEELKESGYNVIVI